MAQRSAKSARGKHGRANGPGDYFAMVAKYAATQGPQGAESEQSAPPPRRSLIRLRRAAPAGTLAALLDDADIASAPDLLDGIIPAASAGGLIAPPKRKKTWFLLLLALLVARGAGSFLDRRLGSGPVLFLALEMSRQQLKARMVRLVGDGERPENFFVLTRGDIPPMMNGGLDVLRERIARDHPALVVIDTWAAFRPAPEGQSLYDADYKAVDVLRALAGDLNCVILFAHHAGKKARGRDPSADVVATHGLGAGASFLLQLDHRPDSGKGWLIVSGNEVPQARIPLRWDERTLQWSLGDGKDARRDDKQQTAEAWLRERLAAGPVLAAEIVAAAKVQGLCSERTLRTVKAKLGIRSFPASGPKAAWSLP